MSSLAVKAPPPSRLSTTGMAVIGFATSAAPAAAASPGGGAASETGQAVYRLRFSRELRDDDIELVLNAVRVFERDQRPIITRRGRGPVALRYCDEIAGTSVGFPDRDRRIVMFRCTPAAGANQYSTAVHMLAQMLAGKLKAEVDVIPENADAARGR